MSSCDTVSKETKLDDKMNDTLNIVSYAENFKIYPIESGYKLVIKDLSSENEDSDVYPYILELGIHKQSILTTADTIKALKNDKTIKNSDRLIICLNQQNFADAIIADFLSYGKYAFSKSLYDTHNSSGHLQVYLLYR